MCIAVRIKFNFSYIFIYIEIDKTWFIIERGRAPLQIIRQSNNLLLRYRIPRLLTDIELVTYCQATADIAANVMLMLSNES